MSDFRGQMSEKAADSSGCDGKTDARCASSTRTIGFFISEGLLIISGGQPDDTNPGVV